MHNIKIKRINTKIPNRRPPRNLRDVINIVDEKAKTVEKTYEVGIRNNKTRQIVKVKYPTDAMQKKIAQIGCAYAKIYNRELEDINMIEKGLYRFKK